MPVSRQKLKNLGENNVYFLPYLMGERSPHNNPNARGTFIGLTMDSTRADMTQAVLEGVALQSVIPLRLRNLLELRLNAQKSVAAVQRVRYGRK